MSNEMIFLGLVFIAVIFLSQAFFLPVYNPQRTRTSSIRKRLKQLSGKDNDGPEEASLLRHNRLEKLGDFRQSLEKIPLIENLSYRLELADSKLMGHQYLLLVLTLSLAAGTICWILTNTPLFAILAAASSLLLCHLKLNRDINKRMEAIEKSFPDALDVLKRGLQAGYAFSDAVKLITEEMDGHIAKEFNLMFININYSKDTKRAIYGFLERVPSVSAMAFASAVMVQKETGGNLAENIEKLAQVIRGRFAFRRRVRAMTAEGRMSGWILVLLPFALFLVIYIQTPTYVAELTHTPEGIRLLKWGGLGMLLGGWWISKLIKIEV